MKSVTRREFMVDGSMLIGGVRVPGERTLLSAKRPGSKGGISRIKLWS